MLNLFLGSIRNFEVILYYLDVGMWSIKYVFIDPTFSCYLTLIEMLVEEIILFCNKIMINIDTYIFNVLTNKVINNIIIVLTRLFICLCHVKLE